MVICLPVRVSGSGATNISFDQDGLQEYPTLKVGLSIDLPLSELIDAILAFQKTPAVAQQLRATSEVQSPACVVPLVAGEACVGSALASAHPATTVGLDLAGNSGVENVAESSFHASRHCSVRECTPAWQ